MRPGRGEDRQRSGGRRGGGRGPAAGGGAGGSLASIYSVQMLIRLRDGGGTGYRKPGEGVEAHAGMGGGG